MIQISNGMIILHLNIQSIRNKLDDLNIYIQNIHKEIGQKIHVIALSEIWIYENENKFYNLSGYSTFVSNRQVNKSGGCMIFTLDEIEAHELVNIEFEASNFLMISTKKFDLNIACIYRYGRADINNFIKLIENEILKHKNTKIVGDININLKNQDTETFRK